MRVFHPALFKLGNGHFLKRGVTSVQRSCGGTYDLIDLGNLGLENGNGISDRGLLGSRSDGGSSEGPGGKGSELLLSCEL